METPKLPAPQYSIAYLIRLKIKLNLQYLHTNSVANKLKKNHKCLPIHHDDILNFLCSKISLIHYFPVTAEIIPLISTIHRGVLTVLILKGIMWRVKVFSIGIHPID